MDRSDDAFPDFVADVEPALLGTAFLLTGRRREARDAVVAALASVHRQWRRLDPAAATAEARRVLVTDVLRRHGSAPQAVEHWDADHDLTAADREWLQALAALPVRTRAAVVLRLYDGLDDDGTVEVLGEDLGTVVAEVRAGLDELASLLVAAVPTAAPPPPAEEPDRYDDAPYRRPDAPDPGADRDAAFRPPHTRTPPRRPTRAPAPPAPASPAPAPQDPDADALYRRPPGAEPRPAPGGRPPETADPDALYRRPG